MTAKRITLSPDDASFIIRAAVRWHHSLLDAQKGTEFEAEQRADLDRALAIKRRAGIGASRLEGMMARAEVVQVTPDLRAIKQAIAPPSPQDQEPQTCAALRASATEGKVGTTVPDGAVAQGSKDDA